MLEGSANLAVRAHRRGVAFPDCAGNAEDAGRSVGRALRRGRRREILLPLLHHCLNQAAPQGAICQAASSGLGTSEPSGAAVSHRPGTAPLARRCANSAPASSTSLRVSLARAQLEHCLGFCRSPPAQLALESLRLKSCGDSDSALRATSIKQRRTDALVLFAIAVECSKCSIIRWFSAERVTFTTDEVRNELKKDASVAPIGALRGY